MYKQLELGNQKSLNEKKKHDLPEYQNKTNQRHYKMNLDGDECNIQFIDEESKNMNE